MFWLLLGSACSASRLSSGRQAGVGERLEGAQPTPTGPRAVPYPGTSCLVIETEVEKEEKGVFDFQGSVFFEPG